VTPADVNFATELMRHWRACVTAFKEWISSRSHQAPEDEALICALDHASDAAKQWVRAKAIGLAPQDRNK
jgi:hypothetical protein